MNNADYIKSRRHSRMARIRGLLLGRILPTLVILAISVTMLFPLYWLVRSSLMKPVELFRKPIQWWPAEMQWQNFADVMELRPFGRWMLNSLLLVAVNVFGSILTSSMVAYALARLKFTGQKLIFTCIMASMMIPGATLLIPQFLMWKFLGLIDTYVPLFISSFAAPGLYTFMLRQFYKGIPRDIDEAATIDGANPFSIYLRIIMPMSAAPLTTVGIFTFTGVWNDFMGPLIYLTSETKYTAALGLRSFVGQFTGQWHYLLAGSMMLVLPVLILFACAQKVFIKGINLSGGLKG